MQEKLTTTEARAGQTTGRMRYVLALSLAGTVIALVIAYMALFT